MAATHFKLNYTFDEPDSRDKPLKVTYRTPTTPEKLPDETDLAPFMGPVHDQGSLGSCTMHSIGYQLTYNRKKATGVVDLFSRLFMYYEGRARANYPVTRDTGLTMRQAFIGAASGIVQEELWPYDTKRFAEKPDPKVYAAAQQCLTYLAVEQSLPELRRCLIKSPVSFGMRLQSSFLSAATARNGQVPVPIANEKSEGGHAMLLVGYSSRTKKFKVMNSWGETWGARGYCYIPEKMILDSKSCGDMWTVRDFAWQEKPSVALHEPVAIEESKQPTQAEPELAHEWMPNLMYGRGTNVTYELEQYICQVAHKSIPMWTPSAARILWRKGNI
ncbi:hypothetical protein DFJ77DRAFT_515124 [Powellomyces hirtus]|nr:hypothetical protein DFJ77DRAFT_515124 [Powellomyces hirtus]